MNLLLTFFYKAEIFYAKKEREASEDADISYRSMRASSINLNNDILLDPNHTHFILVDDGSEGQFGKEITFRAKFENELRRGKSLKYYETERLNQQFRFNNRASFRAETEGLEKEHKELIPMILIVVNGGPNTLLTVVESLKENVPILVLAVMSLIKNLIKNFLKVNLFISTHNKRKVKDALI